MIMRQSAQVTLSSTVSRPGGESRYPRWIVVGFWCCILIATAAVLRRVFALLSPATSGPEPLLNLDSAFASHTALTLAHILPALAFVLVIPFVFWRRTSARRWPYALLFPLGMVVGITAFAMSRFAVGGWIERSAVLLFNSLFLISLARAFVYFRRQRMALARGWLARAIGILLGIATTRPVMGVFFATSSLTGLQPTQFFGIAFWIGFSINLIVVEMWLRKRQQAI